MIIKFTKRLYIFIFEHKKIGETIRYLVIGGISAFLDLLLLYILVNYFKIWYLYATVISFTMVTILGYLGQKYFTFRNYKKNYKKQLFIFFIITGIGLIINITFMFLFVSLMNIWYILASIITKFIVLIWNFITNKKITFKT